MNLVKFCENRYQELTLKTQTAPEYDCSVDSEIKAVHQVLNIYRVVLKWLFVPKTLCNFIQVKLGLKEEPIPVLLNKLKAEKAKKEKEGEKPELKVVPLQSSQTDPVEVS